MESDSPAESDQYRAARLAKLDELKALDIDPYPASWKGRKTIGRVRRGYEDEGRFQKRAVRVAGRILGRRGHGSLVFLDLADATGLIQVMLRRNLLRSSFRLVELLDVGDIVGVLGRMTHTKTGELTIEATRLSMLAKSLRPLPEKHKGLTDQETRVRKRYLTFLSDPPTRKIVETRASFVRGIRRFLEQKGFMEVATPALEMIPGGADAEPFVTHHNALNTDYYLRISLELAHKRLVVGGFERIYEIGRVFRNEGIGREHLQDYDLLEFYWAYADLEDLTGLIEDFYSTVIQNTFGSLVLQYKDDRLDFTPPWDRNDYFDLLKRAGVDLEKLRSTDELLRTARAHEIGDAHEGLGRGRLIDLLYKRLVRPSLHKPQFLMGHPIEVSPLAKRDPERRGRVQRLQVLMAGSEVGNGFAELNDPLDQRTRFEEQMRLRQAGDREAQLLDEDFLEALEHGMPPTAGFGVSIERWLMYLTNSETIRDVVALPLTRPQHYDVFLSYSVHEAGWVHRHIAPALRNWGFRVYDAAEMVSPGSHIADTLRKALARSKTLVAFVSPAWQEQCEAELDAAHRIGPDKVRILPIRVGPAQVPNWLRPVQVLDWTRLARNDLPPSESDLSNLRTFVRNA